MTLSNSILYLKTMTNTPVLLKTEKRTVANQNGARKTQNVRQPVKSGVRSRKSSLEVLPTFKKPSVFSFPEGSLYPRLIDGALSSHWMCSLLHCTNVEDSWV